MLAVPFGFFNPQEGETPPESPFKIAFGWNNNPANEITGHYGAQGGNTYNHLAVVRDSNTINLYLDGANVANGPITGSINFNGSIPLSIGSTNDGAMAFAAKMDEVRISKGVARYTGNFTPPASAFSSDGNTSLLIHFDSPDQFSSNPVIDSAGHTITTTGTGGNFNIYTDGVTNLGKFNRGYIFLNSQDSATPGTSGKYLTTPSDSSFDFGSGNFTIEMWTVGTFDINRTNPMVLVARHTQGGNYDWYFRIQNV